MPSRRPACRTGSLPTIHSWTGPARTRSTPTASAIRSVSRLTARPAISLSAMSGKVGQRKWPGSRCGRLGYARRVTFVGAHEYDYVDLGAGHGRSLRIGKQRFGGIRGVGMEISPEKAAAARKAGASIVL